MGEVTQINAVPVEDRAPVAQQLPALAQLASTSALAASVAIEAQRAAVEAASAKLSALALPRNKVEILARLKELCADPEFAEKAIYAKPQGGKFETNEQGKKEWVDEYVFGPSVHLMTEVANIYGNIDIDVDAHPPINNCTQIFAVVRDLESTVRWRDGVNVPHQRWRKPETAWDDKLRKKVTIKEGYVEEIRDPAQIEMLVKAAKSKLKRNTIRNAISADVIKKVEMWCFNTNRDQELSLAADSNNCFSIFEGRLNVTRAQLMHFLKLKDAKDFKPEHVRRLRALWVSITEGQIDPQDIFKDAKAVKHEPKPAPDTPATSVKPSPTAQKKEEERKAEPPKPAQKEEEKKAPPPPVQPEEEPEDEPDKGDDEPEDDNQEPEPEEDNEPEPEPEKEPPAAIRRGRSTAKEGGSRF